MGKTKEAAGKVMDTAKLALNDTKKTIVKMQRGKAVLSSIKTTLIETPGIPDKVKALLLVDGYGDLAVGMLLNIVSGSVTTNEMIRSAAQDANFVGAVEFSNQFTFIEDLIENSIKKVAEKFEDKKETETE